MFLHYAKYYITPLIVPLVVLGLILGGPWLWLGFAVLAILLVSGDLLLGEDTSEPEYKHTWILEIPLQAALPLLTVVALVFAWACGSGSSDFLGIGAAVQTLTGYDALAARADNVWWHYLGGVLSVGFIVAGYGTNVAHELCHRVTRKHNVVISRWILALSANADFSIEHVHGHHANVCTEKDPATARRGESVYGFFVRSTIWSHISAWEIELARLQRRGYSAFSWRNQMVTGILMTVVWGAIFYGAAGWLGVGLFLAQAFVAKFILEVVNYMEHYGMMRQPGKRVMPHHSWNTNKRMSGMILYSLTRHSAHHERGAKPFWSLPAYSDAPSMPQGYLTTIFICLIPPLWRRVIDPKLAEWDEKYAHENAPVPTDAHHA